MKWKTGGLKTFPYGAERYRRDGEAQSRTEIPVGVPERYPHEKHENGIGRLCDHEGHEVSEGIREAIPGLRNIDSY